MNLLVVQCLMREKFMSMRQMPSSMREKSVVVRGSKVFMREKSVLMRQAPSFDKNRGVTGTFKAPSTLFTQLSTVRMFIIVVIHRLMHIIPRIIRQFVHIIIHSINSIIETFYIVINIIHKKWDVGTGSLSRALPLGQ